MAITKLMHIKERKGNDPSAGLRNSIHYILDDAKTGGTYWVSSNCGDTAEEIYEAMMDTKREFLQISGRQGYHFVISFKPGEADERTAFLVAKKFCEDYLGGDYEYCMAVHNDKAHIHAHVVFNSVSRVDGRKYHYANGDWKADIQPVTDQASVEYGLPPLRYDDETKGIHYQDWKEGKSKIFLPEIRADFDAAIKEAEDYEEFLEILRRKYTIRIGFSRKWDSEYFSVFSEAMGMKNARRNYYLGSAYTVNSIKERIRMKRIPAPYAPLPSSSRLRLVVATIRLDAVKRQPHYSRQQKRYLHSHWRIRKMQREAAGGSPWKKSKESDRLLEELDFFIGNRLFSEQAVEELEERERIELSLACSRLKEKEEWFTPEEEEKILRYRELRERLADESDPAVCAGLQEEIRKLEESLPVRNLLDKYEELEGSRQDLEDKRKTAARSLRLLAEIREFRKEAGSGEERPVVLHSLKQEEVPK